MNFIKGILIGITMMIPGLSGGSCAMILKVYDKLMDCISNLFNIKNIIFLFIFGLGILLGIILFSFCLFNFTSYKYFKYLVTIVIFINIFLLLKEYNKINLIYISLTLLGFISMLIIRNLYIIEIELNVLTYLLIGLLIAISLILPGLGASYILYILGLYDKINISIVNFDYIFLISLGISTIFGIILSAKGINFLLKRDKYIIYSIVIGLLLGGL